MVGDELPRTTNTRTRARDFRIRSKPRETVCRIEGRKNRNRRNRVSYSKVGEDRSCDTALPRAPLENGLEAKRGKDLLEWRRPRQEGANLSLSFAESECRTRAICPLDHHHHHYYRRLLLAAASILRPAATTARYQGRRCHRRYHHRRRSFVHLRERERHPIPAVLRGSLVSLSPPPLSFPENSSPLPRPCPLSNRFPTSRPATATCLRSTSLAASSSHPPERRIAADDTGGTSAQP